METKIICKFLDFTITQSRDINKLVYHVKDKNDEVIMGGFDNMEDLMAAMEKLKRMVNQKTEYIS